MPTVAAGSRAEERSTGPGPTLMGPTEASGVRPTSPVGATQRTAPSATSRCSSELAAACTCGSRRRLSAGTPHRLAAPVAAAASSASPSAMRASECCSQRRCASHRAAAGGMFAGCEDSAQIAATACKAEARPAFPPLKRTLHSPAEGLPQRLQLAAQLRHRAAIVRLPAVTIAAAISTSAGSSDGEGGAPWRHGCAAVQPAVRRQQRLAACGVEGGRPASGRWMLGGGGVMHPGQRDEFRRLLQPLGHRRRLQRRTCKRRLSGAGQAGGPGDGLRARWSRQTLHKLWLLSSFVFERGGSPCPGHHGFTRSP